MEYEQCAPYVCTDFEEMAVFPPDQCNMGGGFQGDQFLVGDTSVDVGQVQTCCKWSMTACAGICTCCIWHIPYAEWLCAYPLACLAQGALDRHT